MKTARDTSSDHFRRILLLIILLLFGLAGLLLVPPFAQPLSYHLFADDRTWLGIPNFNDVVSNIGFAIVGLVGLFAVTGSRGLRIFVLLADRRPYVLFFVAIALISLGSAYYHLEPSNPRLFWDRLPMSVAFMSLIAALIADRIDRRAGTGWLLAILVLLGMVSLVYWIVTELQGCGDLRFYAFIQFYPLVLLPFMLWLFRDAHYTKGRYLVWLAAGYVLAKLFEYYDHEIFALTAGNISGHTLKHVAAAFAALAIVPMLRRQRRAEQINSGVSL